MSDIKEYQINIPQEKLDQTKQKLDLTTFPNDLTDSSWDYGVPLTQITPLIEFWKTKYDWKSEESRINSSLPQFITPIDIDGFGTFNVHFVHKKADVAGVKAIPLIFVHGWPGSFLEVEKILPLLTGGEEGPWFDVVAPSLIGYAFSDGANKKGFSPKHQAQVAHKLMQKLGYNEYVTQGGDWGATITRWQTKLYPNSAVASHLNYLPFAHPPYLTENPLLYIQHALTPYSTHEKERLKRTAWFKDDGYGYNKQQGTKPQTLGYALHDNPVGLLGWIYEKLHDWSDNYPWTQTEIITWISIYLYSTSGPTSAARIYYENVHQSDEDRNELVNKPVPKNVKIGVSVFPKDLQIFPDIWYKTQGNLVFLKKHDDGGHFAAHERPEKLVEDLREMFGKGGAAYGVVNGLDGY